MSSDASGSDSMSQNLGWTAEHPSLPRTLAKLMVPDDQSKALRESSTPEYVASAESLWKATRDEQHTQWQFDVGSYPKFCRCQSIHRSSKGPDGGPKSPPQKGVDGNTCFRHAGRIWNGAPSC